MARTARKLHNPQPVDALIGHWQSAIVRGIDIDLETSRIQALVGRDAMPRAALHFRSMGPDGVSPFDLFDVEAFDASIHPDLPRLGAYLRAHISAAWTR